MNLNVCVFRFQSLSFFKATLEMPVCLQIGDARTVLFDTPINGTTMRISLPECYRGLPLKAQPFDANEAAYKNPNIKLDDLWPCILTGSDEGIAKLNELNTETKLNVQSSNGNK